MANDINARVTRLEQAQGAGGAGGACGASPSSAVDSAAGGQGCKSCCGGGKCCGGGNCPCCNQASQGSAVQGIEAASALGGASSRQLGQ